MKRSNAETETEEDKVAGFGNTKSSDSNSVSESFLR